MTDLVPWEDLPLPGMEHLRPDPPAEPGPEEDLVRWLSAALVAVDERRAELADAGDWQALAYGLAGLKKITAEIRLFADAVETDVYRLLPSKREVVDGLGVVERRQGATRRKWQSEELLGQVLRLALDPDGTGELPPAGELLARIRSALLETVPFTGSLAWRVTALRELGLDPDEWCEKTPGRKAVQITDNRKDK